MDNTETQSQNTIEIKVCWFSVLAEKRGLREEKLDFPKGITAEKMVETLTESLPVLSKYKSSLRIAINKEYAPENTTLRHGDEVAFITPVSGG